MVCSLLINITDINGVEKKKVIMVIDFYQPISEVANYPD